MRTSLNPATLRQGLSLDDLLDATMQAGFEGIEIRLAAAADYVSQRGLPALQQQLADGGLRVAGFGYPVALRATADEFERGLAELPAWCELAVALAVKGGAVGLPWQGEDAAITREETIARLGRLADVAGQYDLALYLEFIALHVPNRVPWSLTLGQTLDLIEAVGRPNVGPLIDSYHWHLGGSQTRDLERMRPGLPIFLHINDAPAGAPVTLDDSMRVLPGEGVLDLPAWLRAIVAATGYDGFLSIELFSEELRALEPGEAARRAKEALDRVLAAL